MNHIGHSRSFDRWPVSNIWATKVAPNAAITAVKNAPHRRANRITFLRDAAAAD